mgnify:CR=1 FL=1
MDDQKQKSDALLFSDNTDGCLITGAPCLASGAEIEVAEEDGTSGSVSGVQPLQQTVRKSIIPVRDRFTSRPVWRYRILLLIRIL